MTPDQALRHRAYRAILAALVRHLERRLSEMMNDGVIEPDFAEGLRYAIRVARGFLRGAPVQPERRRLTRTLRRADRWPMVVNLQVLGRDRGAKAPCKPPAPSGTRTGSQPR